MSTDMLETTRTVAIDEIGRALHEEWAHLSSEIQAATGHPPLRTTTLTLSIVARGRRGASRAREAVHQLADAVPSRVLLFNLDDSGKAPLAQVWAHCSIPRSHRSGHCYDIVEIRIPEERAAAIPNIIALHRVGELPTFVIWLSELDFQHDAVRRVARVADRFVIDSEGFGSPLAALRDYAHFLATTGSSCTGGDLAWARTSTWRELIAQCFDMPRATRAIKDINRIDIAFDASAEAGAFLLASWFSSRLGFTPTSVKRGAGTTALYATCEEGRRRLRINLDHSHSAGFGMRAVRLQAHGGETAVRVTVQRKQDDRSTVRLETSQLPRQERIVHHPIIPLEHLIGAELMRFKRDKIYEETLAQAAQFARLCLESGNGELYG